MPTASTLRQSRLEAIAPQFLVDDLQRSITYYCERLGFALEFTYESFYASVVRDGCAIHLKHGPAAPQERERRKNDEHLDAYVTVTGVSELFAELKRRGAVLLKPLENRQWGCQDFYVEDPDGYVLCFSERQRS